MQYEDWEEIICARTVMAARGVVRPALISKFQTVNTRSVINMSVIFLWSVVVFK